eukprot:SAG11_NODE_4656_length_1819_cov_1.351163_2_plen_95_part_00
MILVQYICAEGAAYKRTRMAKLMSEEDAGVAISGHARHGSLQGGTGADERYDAHYGQVEASLPTGRATAVDSVRRATLHAAAVRHAPTLSTATC